MMQRYAVLCTRVTTYQIYANSPQEAADLVLDGEGREVDNETLNVTSHHWPDFPLSTDPIDAID
jgi:hypothetical protein